MSDEKKGAVVDLTTIQLDILHLVAQSKTSKQIANELGISHHTVDAYTWSAMKKLGVDSRAKAAEMVVNPRNINFSRFIYESEDVADGQQNGVNERRPEQGESGGNIRLAVNQPNISPSHSSPSVFKLLPVGGKRHDLNIGQKLTVVGQIALVAVIFAAALGTIIVASLHLLGR
jgi:DNA-binding CsgD family transcriptional regulator